MANSRGMVSIGGATYRLLQRNHVHDVVRILDDQIVGSFQSEPRLRVVAATIGDSALLAVATEALHQGRLPWAPRTVPDPGVLAHSWHDARTCHARATALIRAAFAWLLRNRAAKPLPTNLKSA